MENLDEQMDELGNSETTIVLTLARPFPLHPLFHCLNIQYYPCQQYLMN